MKRISRILLWGVCLLVSFGVIFMLSLPTIVSTDWARKSFLQDFNTRIQGELSIDRWQFGWLASQEISGLKLYDGKGEKVLSIDYLTLSSPLLKLLWQRYLDFAIHNLNAKIEWFKTHETNFNEILNLKNTSKGLTPISSVILENVGVNVSTRYGEAFATGTISNGKQSGQFQLNANLLPELKVSADVKNLPVQLLELFIPSEIQLGQLIGKTVDLTVKQKKEQNASTIQAAFSSQQVEGTMNGILQGSHLSLSEPAIITLQTIPELNQLFFDGQFAFIRSDKIQLDIDQLNLSFKEPYEANLSAHLKLPELQAAGKNVIRLDELKLNLSRHFEDKITHYRFEGRAHPSREDQRLPPLYFNCAGDVYFEKSRSLVIPYHFEGFQTAEKKTPNLKINGVWSSDIHQKRQFSARGKASDFPLLYLKLWDLHPALLAALGPTLNSDFLLTVDDIALRKGNLEFDAIGTNWQTEGTLVLDDQIKVPSPLKGRFTVNPKEFDQLQDLLLLHYPQRYALLEPCTLEFKVNKSAFSFLSGEDWQTNQRNTYFDLSVSTTPIQMINVSSKKQMKFLAAEFHTSSDNLLNHLKFGVNISEESQKMSLVAQGTAKEIFRNQAMDFSRASIDADLKMHQFSLPLFIRLVASDQLAKKIEALIGTKVSADTTAKIQDLQGPLNLSIWGENGKLALDGKLENGRLVLLNPLTAQVKATPEFGKEFLKEILPPFSQVVKSDEMLQVILDSKGFSFPFSPFDLHAIQIEKGTLILGKMVFTNRGLVRTLLTFLKGNLNPETTAWFTPLYFSMQKGSLTLKRIDVLMDDQYPVALWGNISLVKDKVNLIIGIRKPALSYAFGLKDLPNGYVMQIPLTGTLEKANLNVTQAAGKISALIAKNQTNSTSQLVGTLLDVVSGRLTEEKVPPPTTTPFPWDKATP